MKLVVAGTFGSLPEATIAFSYLSSAGFNPVAGFNMNTPGIASGMAPSAYRVLVPETEAQAAHQLLSDIAQSPTNGGFGADDEVDQTEQHDDLPSGGALSGLRPVVRRLVVALLVTWFVINCLMLLRRCSPG
jgi:hypothetical protein